MSRRAFLPYQLHDRHSLKTKEKNNNKIYIVNILTNSAGSKTRVFDKIVS
jgi:hypothetical protein